MASALGTVDGWRVVVPRSWILVVVFLCESSWSSFFCVSRPGAEHGVGFGTALKCDHSTSILDCRLGVVLCVCDV